MAQTLLGENETVKERIRFLEAIVQDITKEKDNLRAMVTQLTTSKVCWGPRMAWRNACYR